MVPCDQLNAAEDLTDELSARDSFASDQVEFACTWQGTGWIAVFSQAQSVCEQIDWALQKKKLIGYLKGIADYCIVLEPGPDNLFCISFRDQCNPSLFSESSRKKWKSHSSKLVTADCKTLLKLRYQTHLSTKLHVRCHCAMVLRHVWRGGSEHPSSKAPFKGSWRGPREGSKAWTPSSPLRAPFVPPSSSLQASDLQALQAPFKPPSSPLQAPFKPPSSPLKAPLVPPSSRFKPLQSPASPLRARFKPPSSFLHLEATTGL